MPDFNKICESAGSIINYLNNSFMNDENSDSLFLLAVASGLSGVACFEAAKALNSELMVVDTKIGEKFYFSNKANEFLFESEYSIRSCILGFCSKMAPNEPLPTIESAIVKISSSVGNPNYKICDMIDPKSLYSTVKNCWDVIFPNAISGKFEPDDWALIMGVVVQNIMVQAMAEMPLNQLSQFSFECACYLSKIGPDTYSTNI